MRALLGLRSAPVKAGPALYHIVQQPSPHPWLRLDRAGYGKWTKAVPDGVTIVHAGQAHYLLSEGFNARGRGLAAIMVG